MGLSFLPAFILPFLLLSGLFINDTSIPVHLKWLSYLSPIRYGFRALAQNEFTGLVFRNCPGPEVPMGNPDLPECRGETALVELGLEGTFGDTSSSSGGRDGIIVELAALVAIFLCLLGGSALCLARSTKRGHKTH